jgi:zinc transport system substrate-binding protein
MRSRGLETLVALCAVLLAPRPAGAEVKVVATVKPIHSLVAQVMAGIGAPGLIVQGLSSPHTYALKPSDARRLNAADVLFRVSESLEPFTARLVKSLPKSVQVVTLAEGPGVRLLARRTADTFERHEHGAGSKAHAHEHPERDKGEIMDGHIWLDPDNTKAMVENIAQVLSAKDPANADRFRANAEALKSRIDALAADLERDLKPIAGKPYIVFHDAFQYLERRFGLNPVGSISISPDVPPSAKRLAALRKKIASLGATCVFAEPQFEPKLVRTVIEGTNARTGTLDPEGATLAPGPDLYFTLMRNLASELKACLSPPA